MRAAHDNVAALVIVVAAALWFARWVIRSLARGAPQPWASLDPRVYRWAVPALLVFTIVRNLPVGALLAPVGGFVR